MRRKKRFRLLDSSRIKDIQGVKPKKQRIKRRIMIIYTIFFATLITLIYRYNCISSMDSVVAMSQMEIQSLSFTLINKAVQNTIANQDIKTEDLVFMTYNDSGDITGCNLNTVVINRICAGVIDELGLLIKQVPVSELNIPLGKVFGDGMISNLGPKIRIKIRPYGTANISYDRTFVSTGINSINFRVWLNVEMTMQVVIPFDERSVKIHQEVILVDQVINGSVPEQYIKVPEDEMLNFAN